MKTEELNKRDWFWLLLLIVAAFFLRFDFVAASGYVIDADEGIVGLMAKHIMEGKGIPTFYYGQDYMGSLEALLAAGVFKVFGISNFALKSVPIFFSLLVVVLVFLITLELWDKRAAWIAAILCSFAPSALIIWSAKARGGFIEILFLGGLSFYLCIRWLKNKDLSLAGMIPIGLILGLGWWVNNQILYFIVPIVFAIKSAVLYEKKGSLFKRVLRLEKYLFMLLFSFFIGSLAFWVYNFNHSFASFGMFGLSTPREILKHLTGLFALSIPILLGGKPFWAEEDYFPEATSIIYVIYGLLALNFLWLRRKNILQLFRLYIDRERPSELCMLFVGTALAVFVLSSFGHLVQAPRYLLPIYVGLFPLLGVSLSMLWERWKLASLAILVLLLTINLLSSYPGRRAIPGEPFVFKGERVSRDHSELISFLLKENVSWVRTNYWIGYKLAFESKEKIKFLIYHDPIQVRIKSYQEEGNAYGCFKTPFVLVPSQAGVVREALAVLRFQFKEIAKSGYQVIYDIQPPYNDLIQSKVPLTSWASSHNEAAMLGIDGNEHTRWGSAKPQSPGMEYKVILEEPRTIRGVALDLGDWPQDYPRGLGMHAVGPDGKEISSEDFSIVNYITSHYVDCSTGFVFYIKPTLVKELRFIETGSHPVFDWSIAELKVFE